VDKWKYYDIRHERHLLCNPMNKEKFERVCSLLRLKRGARVLDIACGKGEFLVRLAEPYDISGVGVERARWIKYVSEHTSEGIFGDTMIIALIAGKVAKRCWCQVCFEYYRK